MTRSHWINAKRSGTCGCGSTIERTFRVLWFPIERRALCQACGTRYLSKERGIRLSRIDAAHHAHQTRPPSED